MDLQVSVRQVGGDGGAEGVAASALGSSVAVQRVVDVEGTPYERGLAQGSTYRDELGAGLDSLLSLGLAPSWLPASIHRWAVRGGVSAMGGYYCWRHRPVLERHAEGRHWSFLRGLAAGFGVGVAPLYGLNAAEIETCLVGFRMGCTSLAFGSEQTASGQPKLAYNHDFPPAFAPFLVLRRSTPRTAGGRTDGFRSLSLSYSVLAGAMAGVNERGLAISVNQAFATDLARSRPALFVSLLVQDCLERCGSVGQAAERLSRLPVSNGAMVSLVDAAGDRAVVELSGTQARVRRGRPDHVLHAFNKYGLPHMSRFEVPVGAVTTGLAPGYDIHECNLTRERRLPAISQRGSRVSDEDIRDILADHDGGDGDMNTICRHEDPIQETIVAAVLDPAARAMSVLFGKPCQERFQRVAL